MVTTRFSSIDLACFPTRNWRRKKIIRPKLVLKTSDPTQALKEGDLDAVKKQTWMSEGKEPELASGSSGFLLVCVSSVLVLVLVVSVLVL